MFIPGRIEFLGKHTDYCGGRSLVCAIDRGFHTVFTPTENRSVQITSEDSGETVSFKLSEDLQVAQDHWAKYPMTVAKRLAQNFKSRKLIGVDLSFRSDLPAAAGLSSSSALMIAFFAALADVNQLPLFEEYKQNIANNLELAEYLGCIENGQTFRGLPGCAGVGTFGGSQDHTAILSCRKNYLSQFLFAPVVLEKELYLPPNLSFVVASSGVIAEKTGAARAKYNRVSQMVSEIVNRWKGAEKSLAQIIEAAGLDDLKKFIAENDFSFEKQELLERVGQFYVETYEIIPKVSECLENGEVEKIGELIDLSQQNAERYLHNQAPETIYLQRLAREIGALASSAFGAGFGGSVYALVNTSDSNRFAGDWRENDLKMFPQLTGKAEFFVTKTAESRI